MMAFLRVCFFALVVRPVIWVAIGLNIRHRERLPRKGPAMVVANHNSHMDTLALMSLFPLAMLGRVHPVGAADYFADDTPLGWFARHMLGVLPLDREARARGEDPFVMCREPLRHDNILILFPEGTRGEPERLSTFKKGIAYLAAEYPDVPIVPVFLHGFGKVLPKGDWLPVPFFCDVFVGLPLPRAGSPDAFMAALMSRMTMLSAEGRFPAWE
ncbi:MAG: 1-acyl-sn-glycerol-3-phosphate acyltransferase [Rhodospirillaceae bacterium]|nr:1-acyl-sn-glycerol-3-phosphate acyltransferase [Rhodospirillaceae bacterium]